MCFNFPREVIFRPHKHVRILICFPRPCLVGEVVGAVEPEAGGGVGEASLRRNLLPLLHGIRWTLHDLREAAGLRRGGDLLLRRGFGSLRAVWRLIRRSRRSARPRVFDNRSIPLGLKPVRRESRPLVLIWQKIIARGQLIWIWEMTKNLQPDCFLN